MTYHQLKTRINELVPETMEPCSNQHPQVDVYHHNGHSIPITLEHVLIAIEKVRKELMRATMQADSLVVEMGDKHMVWHLPKSLSDQSQETWDFLGEVLGV